MNLSRVRAASKASPPSGAEAAARPSHAGMADEAQARSGAERRKGSRHATKADQRQADRSGTVDADFAYSLIGNDCVYNAPVIFFAAIATWLLTGFSPPPMATALIAAAFAMTSVSRKAQSLERNLADTLLKKQVVLQLVVGGPMFLYAIALSIWTQGLPPSAIVMVACAGLVVTLWRSPHCTDACQAWWP